MKIRNRKDKSDPLFDEDVEKNRISGIEPTEKGKNSKKVIIILLITTIAILSILIIVSLIYKKPGSIISKTGSGLLNEILPEKSKKVTGKITNPLLQKAIDDYRKGYRANAISGFNSIVESDSNDTDKSIALLYLGIIADQENRHEEALSFFKRGLSYNENNSEIYLARAKTYRKLRDFQKALKDADKSDVISPGPDSKILLGNINFEKGDFDKALKYYQEAMKIDSSNSLVMYNTAITLFRLGDRFSAIEYLKKAAVSDKIGEIAYRSYSRLGTELLESNMLDQSEKYLKQAIALRPNEPSPRYNLSLLYLKKGDNIKAVAELEESERLGQENKKLLENIGEAYTKLKDYDKSLRVYEKILETDKNNIKYLSRLGDLYYKNGNLDKAYGAFKKITRIDPTSENARISYLNMGNILDDTGKYEDAIKAYESALSINSRDDQVYYNMGLTYKNAKKPELAISSWQKAMKINPHNLKVMQSMGDYYMSRGHINLAENVFQDIVYKWKDNEEALFKLGTIYHKQKNHKDAEEAYRRIISLNRNSNYTSGAYINLSMILANQSNGEEGLRTSMEMVKKALLIKPGDSDALLALGIIYDKTGKREKAIDTFYQVIKSTNDSLKIGESYNNIGKSYYKMKKYQKSIEAFTRGIENDPTSEELRINRKAAAQAYEKELSRVR